MLQWHAQLNAIAVDSRVLCFQKGLDDSDILASSLLADRAESIKSHNLEMAYFDEAARGEAICRLPCVAA
jgi:hypothetical protein